MSEPTTTLSMDALRASLELVLEEVQRRHGDEIDLRADSYWVLPSKYVYDHGVLPTVEMQTLGSLVDDVEAVRELALGGGPGVVVWHDLAHLVGVLQRLAFLDRP